MKIRIMACVIGALSSLNAFAVPITVDDFYTPDSTTFTIDAAGGLLANDSTSDGGLKVISYSVPSQGTLALTTDGSFTYMPDSGQSSNTVVTYTASDNSNTFSSADVTFDMVSTLPSAADDNYTPDSTTFSVNANNGWLSNDSGGIGSLSAVSYQVPSQGSLSASTDGSFTYTPDVGQSTNETISYTMRDDLNRLSTANVTFDLKSTLPVAADDFYTPDATVFSVNANNGWLTNDTGGIGSLSTVSYQVPSQGVLSASTDGSFTYTPDVGQSTNEIIKYTMRDALSRLSTGEVTFDLESTLPSAVNDFYTMLAGENLVVDPLGLLSNDLLGIGTLSVVAFTPSADGLLNLSTNGSFSFAPNAGFTGLTSFDYFMRDSLGRTSSALATIEVVGANSVPEASTLWLMLVGLIAAGRRLISR